MRYDQPIKSYLKEKKYDVDYGGYQNCFNEINKTCTARCSTVQQPSVNSRKQNDIDLIREKYYSTLGILDDRSCKASHNQVRVGEALNKVMGGRIDPPGYSKNTVLGFLQDWGTKMHKIYHFDDQPVLESFVGLALALHLEEKRIDEPIRRSGTQLGDRTLGHGELTGDRRGGIRWLGSTADERTGSQA